MILLKLFFFIIYLHGLVAALPPSEPPGSPLPSRVAVPAPGLRCRRQNRCWMRASKSVLFRQSFCFNQLLKSFSKL